MCLRGHIRKERRSSCWLFGKKRNRRRGRETSVWQWAKIGQIWCWQQSMSIHKLLWEGQLYLQRNGILVMGNSALYSIYNYTHHIVLKLVQFSLFPNRLAGRCWLSIPLHISQHRAGFDNLKNKDGLNYFFINAFHKLKFFMSTNIHLNNFLFTWNRGN